MLVNLLPFVDPGYSKGLFSRAAAQESRAS